MRYLIAFVCPPLALWLCHRVREAVIATVFCLVGLATVRWGLGILILFGCILWAVNAVGDSRAAAVSAQFIRQVKPIRRVRG